MRTNSGFTLMEMLIVMMIIALAYGMMLPRLSFDSKQTQPELLEVIKKQYNEVRQKGITKILFMDEGRLLLQAEGKPMQALLKRRKAATWRLNGEQPKLIQLVSIINPDGTMAPATLQYQCGNRQFSINLTAFRGIHYQGQQTSDDEDPQCYR